MVSAYECKACERIAKTRADDPGLVWMSDLWVLRHAGAPYAAVGWMTMHSRRHIPGALAFSDAEASDFGHIVKRISQALIDATGAERVYLGSLSEGTPHFHLHLVPRYSAGPSSWDAFGDLARARAGLLDIDPEKVEAVIQSVGQQLKADLSASPQLV